MKDGACAFDMVASRTSWLGEVGRCKEESVRRVMDSCLMRTVRHAAVLLLR